MKTFKEALNDVNTLSDSLEIPMDEKIKPIIAALMMHGFVTSSSCQGHPEEGGRCYPFVLLNHPAPEDEWEEQAREAWYQQNIKQQNAYTVICKNFTANTNPKRLVASW